MATNPIPYRTDSELPVVSIYWLQADKTTYYDFASGWTFTVLVVNTAGTVLLTKTTGNTGATGTATTANLTIAWAAGELATIGAGTHTLWINARRTADSFDLPINANQRPRILVETVPT